MTDAPTRVLVVGGGFIATALARGLRRDGHAVTVTTGAPRPGDFSADEWRPAAAVTAALAEAEAVVYAAGRMIPSSASDSLRDAMVECVLPVVALAEEAAGRGVRQFVFLSSGGTVYGHAPVIPTAEDTALAPINLYGTCKAQTELGLRQLAQRCAMSVVTLRVANAYGPGQLRRKQQGFIAAAVAAGLAGAPLTLWGGDDATRDFVFIDDVVRACSLVVARRTGDATLNIAAGRETSLRRVLDAVQAALDAPLAIVYADPRGIDVRRSALSIRRAGAVLDWHPLIELDEGVRRVVQWMKRDDG